MLGHAMLMAAGGSGGAASYKDLVLADGASHAWFLGETSGTTATDSIGIAHGAYVASPLLAQPAPAGLKSITLNGSSQYISNKNDVLPLSGYSYELIIKTTVKGGALFQANNTGTTSPSGYDRHAYINSSGNVIIGVYNGSVRYAVSSRVITDGLWHHVVMSLSGTGCTLYVDGESWVTLPYASNDAHSKFSFGGGRLDSWPQNNGNYLSGQIAAPAIYPFAMPQAMAAAHAAKAST